MDIMRGSCRHDMSICPDFVNTERRTTQPTKKKKEVWRGDFPLVLACSCQAICLLPIDFSTLSAVFLVIFNYLSVVVGSGRRIIQIMVEFLRCRICVVHSRVFDPFSVIKHLLATNGRQLSLDWPISPVGSETSTRLTISFYGFPRPPFSFLAAYSIIFCVSIFIKRPFTCGTPEPAHLCLSGREKNTDIECQ